MIDKIEVNGQVEDIVNKVLKYVCVYGKEGDLLCTIEIPLMLDKEETITSLSQLREKIKSWSTEQDAEFVIPAEGKYGTHQITGIYNASDYGIGVRLWNTNIPMMLISLHDQNVRKVITQEL